MTITLPTWGQVLRGLIWILVWVWRLLVLGGVALLVVRPFWQQVVDWGLVLDYLRVLVWPLIVVLVIFLFRRKLLDLFDGHVDLAVGSFRAAFGRPAPQSTSEAAGDEGAEAPQIEAPSANAPVAPTATDAQQWSDALMLATKYIDFERTHRLIYGTQLQALSRLRGYTNGLAASDLMEFLNRHIERASARNYPITVYYHDIPAFMDFLVRTNLSEYDPATQAFKITQKGVDFLDYLAELSLPLDGKYDTNI